MRHYRASKTSVQGTGKKIEHTKHFLKKKAKKDVNTRDSIEHLKHPQRKRQTPKNNVYIKCYREKLIQNNNIQIFIREFHKLVF